MGNDSLFEDDIRGRKAKDGKRSQLTPKAAKRVLEMHRTAKGFSEVVVKVTSYGKDIGRAAAHADYITRAGKENGDLPVNMADGSLLTSKEELSDVLGDWFSQGARRQYDPSKKGNQLENKKTVRGERRTANIVLSSPEGTKPHQVREAVRTFAGNYFTNNDHMFVIHEDTKNTHAHLTVKTRGFDGKQLRLGKQQLKAMRDTYALALREHGVEVNSTYRSQRSVGTRAASRALRELKVKQKQADRELLTDEKIRRKAAELLKNPHIPDPIRERIRENHKNVVSEYAGTAKFLRTLNDKGADRVAIDLEKFATSLKFPQSPVDREVKRQQVSKQKQFDKGQLNRD